MIENLTYSIFVLDELSNTFNLIYENSNVYATINAYSYFKRKYRHKYLKICRDLYVFGGI